MNINRPTTTLEPQRSSILKKIPDSIRNHFVAMCGEYVGTVLFLFFALSGTQVANTIPSSGGKTVAEMGANPQQLQYIALCFGFSLAVNAWVFFRISGGLFNPAVTFGMCLIGALPWIRGALLFVTQVLGGITAAALVSCMFPGPLNVRTELGGGTSIVQGLFIEMFLTAQLVFTIFMLAAEKHKGTFIAPVGIGLALFIAELTGVYFTGGSLNPARSFGPNVVLRAFHGYHWIYWLGPILGSVVAAGFYKFIKVLEYETANPGQDRDHATRVDKKAALLIAAGINEIDAHKVANELSDKEATLDAGGPNGTVIANGQGRREQDLEQPMYGTNFRQPSTRSAHAKKESDDSAKTIVQSNRDHRPEYSRQVAAVAAQPRTDSPAMATNEQLYGSLVHSPDVPLGGNVHDDPRLRYGRTPSSYA